MAIFHFTKFAIGDLVQIIDNPPSPSIDPKRRWNSQMDSTCGLAGRISGIAPEVDAEVWYSLKGFPRWVYLESWLQQKTCPECKGTGVYIGFSSVEPCQSCQK